MATWYPSSRAISAEWAPAWWLRAPDSASRTAVNSSPWTPTIRTCTLPANGPFHTIIPGPGHPKDRGGMVHLRRNGGANFSPWGHVSVLTNVIDFGMNIQEAGDALRWLHNRITEPTDSADDMLMDGRPVCRLSPTSIIRPCVRYGRGGTR